MPRTLALSLTGISLMMNNKPTGKIMRKLLLGLMLLLPTTVFAATWTTAPELTTPDNGAFINVLKSGESNGGMRRITLDGDNDNCLRGDGALTACTNDTAYNEATWNANLDAASKNAIRDWFETLQTSIDLNTAKTTYNSTDSTKVGYISITQAVNLDTVESDTATNNAKATNATHGGAGDVFGSGDLTIQPASIDLAMLSATGTRDSTTFYRGDGVFAIPSGSGGAATWLELTDTPSSFTANYWVKVNSAGDALELVVAPTGTGDMLTTNNLSDVANAATSYGNIKQAATDAVTGAIELATSAEVVTGTDASRAVTPDTLTDKMAAPGAIGATTAAAAAFTTVTATSVTVTGADNTHALELGNNSSAAGSPAAGFLAQNNSVLEYYDTAWRDVYHEGNKDAAIAGESITSGTVADARIASTISRDSEVALKASLTGAAFTGAVTALASTATYATAHTLSTTEASGQFTLATAAVVLTLPTAVAGYSGCFAAGQGVTAIIQLTPGTGDYLVVDGARGTAATAYASSGTAGDKICFIAANADDWYITSEVGTWSE